MPELGTVLELQAWRSKRPRITGVVSRANPSETETEKLFKAIQRPRNSQRRPALSTGEWIIAVLTFLLVLIAWINTPTAKRESIYERLRNIVPRRPAPEVRITAKRKKLAAKWRRFATRNQLSFCQNLFTDDGDIDSIEGRPNLALAFTELVGLRSGLYFSISHATTSMVFLALLYGLLLAGGIIAKPLMKEPPTADVSLIYKSFIVLVNIGILAVVAWMFVLTLRRNLLFTVERKTREELLSRCPAHVPVIYTDDFGHGLGDWKYQGNWSIVKDDGTNVLAVTNSDQGGYVPGCQSWQDYIVEFETKIVAECSAWLIRAKDTGTYVMLQCNSSTRQPHPNALRLHYRVNGEWRKGEILAIPMPLSVPTNKWFGVRIEVRTSRVRVMLTVDGKKADVSGLPSSLLSHPNACLDHNFGSFGFREAGGEYAYFRNLSARTIA